MIQQLSLELCCATTFPEIGFAGGDDIPFVCGWFATQTWSKGTYGVRDTTGQWTLRHVGRDTEIYPTLIDKIKMHARFVYPNELSVRVHKKMKLNTMCSTVSIYICGVNSMLQIPTHFLAHFPPRPFSKTKTTRL